MKSYSFKKHLSFSIIISLLIGAISFLIFNPSHMNSSIGVIESIDNPEMIHTQISYGYGFIFTLFLLSLIILIALFKPTKKFLNQKYK